MTIYSLDVLLFLFGTSLLFHVRFCLFLTCIQVSQEAGKVVWDSHLFKISYYYWRASLVAQMGKCLPAMWETWIQSLGWEDPLEKEMATHSSTLA